MFDNSSQVLQMVRMLVFLMTLEHLGTDELLKVLIPQAIFAACCRALDFQPVLVDGRFCPSLDARPAEGMATSVIIPMLVDALRGTPIIAPNVKTIV
jgi:hypothetical protein